MALNSIEETYRARTTKSLALLKRAARSLPGGLSRNYGYHPPYPVVHERGEGPHLWDVDGNRYVDLNYNGLSLIHGHAYRPVIEALESAMPRAGPGSEPSRRRSNSPRRCAAASSLPSASCLPIRAPKPACWR